MVEEADRGLHGRLVCAGWHGEPSLLHHDVGGQSFGMDVDEAAVSGALDGRGGAHIAMLEGLVLGESVGCLVEEIADYQEKTLFCDKTAAVALATAKGGSWRTRHLKVRAAHLRHKVEAEEWKVAHKAGLDMVADIGTKALRGDRITVLNELMKVMPAPRTAEVATQALVDSEESEQRRLHYLRPEQATLTTYESWFQEDLQKVAKLVALIELFQQIQTVASMNPTEEPMESNEGERLLLMLSTVMVICGMSLVKILEGLWTWCRRPSTRLARLTVEEFARDEPVTVNETDLTPEIAGEDPRRGGGEGAADPDGQRRGDQAEVADGPGGAAQLVDDPLEQTAPEAFLEEPRRWRDMTVEEIFAAAAEMSDASVDSEALADSSDEPPGERDLLRGAGDGPIITLRGERFHRRESCPSLNRSRAGRRGLCRRCGDSYADVNTVYLDTRGAVHCDPRCASLAGLTVRFRACFHCG